MKLSGRRGARLLCTWVFVLTAICLAAGQGSKKNSEFDAVEDRDRDNPKAREQWFLRGRTMANGEVAAELRFRAYQQKLQMRQQLFRARAVTAVPHASSNGWLPLGPAPLNSDPGTGQNYGWVSGRATAVAIDPADVTGNTVFIGGAHGGVWKTINGAAASAGSVVWNPVLDYEATLAIGSIAVQPCSSPCGRKTASSIVLVGTGEPNSSADSYYGLGILRSADGGATWTLITGETGGKHTFAGLGFSKIAFSTANPNLVVASAAAAAEGYALGLESPVTVNRGIYYSQDAGQTWHYASILDGANTVSPGSVTSVVYNAVAGRFFAAVRYHGIYSSTDGQTWTRLADANQPGAGLTTANCPVSPPAPPTPSACPIYRAELTVVPGRFEMYTWVVAIDPNTFSEVDVGVWQNLNAGTTSWNKITDDGITNCGDGTNNGCGVDQGTYNLEIAALPDGSGTDLYAGTINIYKCRITNPSAPSCSFLNLTHVYNLGCLSIANVHPDQHHLAGVVTPSNTELMYFANDGGVYRALDGYTGLTTGTCGGNPNAFDDLNGTLGSMTQFVSFSVHPTDPATMLGGTQDNGSPSTASAGTSLTWLNAMGGDGGYNAISPTTPTDWFTAGSDVGPGGLFLYHCGSGINCNANSFQLVVTSGQVGNDDGAFYFPYMLDPQTSSELLLGTCRVWRGGPATSSGTYTALSNNFDTGDGTACSGGEVNLVRSLAAAPGSPPSQASKVVYAGTDGLGPGSNVSNVTGGRVFVTTNAGTPPVGTLMADRTGSINPGEFPVSAIAIDPSDATGQTAYVAIMGFHVEHVFKTTNAGQTWNAFDGTAPSNLEDAPANSLLVDPQAGVLYVGTDVGVFVSSTNAPSWSEVGPEEGQGGSGFLPNVPVTTLRLFNSGGKKLLRASTYGRGIWQYDLQAPTTPDYSIAISDSPQTIFPGQSATFHGTLTALNGYAGAVNLSCTAGTTGPPATCTPSPASQTPTGTGAAFTVSASGIVQDYFFNVNGVGTDAGSTTHDAAVTLQVVDIGAPSPASVSVQQGNASQGITFLVSGGAAFSGTVTLSCPTGIPAGVTCNFAPSASVSALPETVTLTFTASPSAALGTAAITISANASGDPTAKTQSVSLTVTAPAADYTLAISNSPQSATVNSAATFNGTLQARNGYASAVNLSCGAEMPPTCTVSPNPVTPTVAGAAFTLTTQSDLARAYNFNVNGTGTDAAHVAHTASATFNSLFTLTIADSTLPQTLNAGQSAQYTLEVTPVGSTTFPSVVNITCSGLPAGATCSNPSVAAGASGAQTVTLTISTLGPGKAALRLASIQRPAQAELARSDPGKRKTGSRMPFVLWASAVAMMVGGFVRRPSVRKNAAVLMVLLVVSTLILTSCGGSGGSGGGFGGGGGLVSVRVSPSSASKFPAQTQQFTAAVSGSTNTAVTWQVNGAMGGSPATGTIDAGGLYTAPAAVPNPATVMVSAVSQADVTRSDTAQVMIEAPTPSGTYTVTVTATAGSVVQTTAAVLVVN